MDYKIVLDNEASRLRDIGFARRDIDRIIEEKKKALQRSENEKKVMDELDKAEQASGVKFAAATKQYIQFLNETDNIKKVREVMDNLTEQLGLGRTNISFAGDAGLNEAAADNQASVMPSASDAPAAPSLGEEDKERDILRQEVENAAQQGLLKQDDGAFMAEEIMSGVSSNAKIIPGQAWRTNPDNDKKGSGGGNEGIGPADLKNLKTLSELFSEGSSATATGLGEATNVAIPSTPLSAASGAGQASSVLTPGAGPGYYGAAPLSGGAAPVSTSGVASGGKAAAAGVGQSAAPGAAATAAGLAAGAAFVYAGKTLFESDTKKRLRRQLQENGGFTAADEFGTQIGQTKSAGIIGGGISGFAVDMFDPKRVSIGQQGQQAFAIKGLNKDTAEAMLDQAAVVFNSFNQNVENTFVDSGITKDISANIFSKGFASQKELESMGFKGIGSYQEGKFNKGGNAMLGKITATTFAQLTNGARTGKVRMSTLQGQTTANEKELKFLQSINLTTHDQINANTYGVRIPDK